MRYSEFVRQFIIIDIDWQKDFIRPTGSTTNSKKDIQKVQPLVMTCIVRSERFSAYEYIAPKLLTM